MTVDVVNSQNQKVGSVDVRDDVFGGRVKTDLIWESVTRQNASERRGTHATKVRGDVSGSGKKPWRQKGTGRARVGETRNPLWRKGGTVFGPQPRSYDYQLPKKVEKAALREALSQRLKDGDVIVVDALSVSEAKTKAAAAVFKGLGVSGKTLVARREARPDVQPGGAQRGRRASGAEQPRDGARRDGHGQGRGHARGDRTAAGGIGVMKLTDVIRRPLVTEKTTILREDGLTLVLQVATHANKMQIRRAVETLFGSKVADVRTTTMRGKIKRQGRFAGRRPDWKKAYVRLREGEKLPEFIEGA